MPEQWVRVAVAAAALGVSESYLYDIAKADGWRVRGWPREFHLDDVKQTWQDRQKETS